MKYQIQKYNLTDFQEPEKREVIAEIDAKSQMNESELSEWATNAVSDKIPGEGFAFTTVPENHHWFKHAKTEAVASVSNSMVDMSEPSPTLRTYETAPVPFSDICRIEIEASQKGREEQLKAEQRLQAAMQKLSQ